MSSNPCSSANCGCTPSIPRRDFLKAVSLSAAGLLPDLPALAGPFDASDFARLIPAEKKLAAPWLRSLTERGAPTVLRGDALRYVGMPIGGIACGQLYLGGDGRLWHWDIFNVTQDAAWGDGRGPHYEKPVEPNAPLLQGFALKLTRNGQSEIRPLDRRGFKDIAFRGQYPVGLVDYHEPAWKLNVTLEAFSPFIPLNLDDSSLPATVLEFTVKNTGTEPLDVEISGWLENAVCLASGSAGRGVRRNRVRREGPLALLHCTAEGISRGPQRPDIVFEDFEKETWDGWIVTGTAFGQGPVEAAKLPAYQGNVGAAGKRFANSHHTRNGEDVAKADAHIGTLTSRPFVIERDYIVVRVGGGSHQGKTCVNLLLDGQVIASIAGANSNRLRPFKFHVHELSGRTAQLQIVDNETGSWGNIGVDQIVFSDSAGAELSSEEDHGSLALALLSPGTDDFAAASVRAIELPESGFPARNTQLGLSAALPFGNPLVGALGRRWQLAPGAEGKATFVLAWNFPAVRRELLAHLTDIRRLRRAYAKRFADAASVAIHVAERFDHLAATTRLWHSTWSDSTLPWWFMERTFLNNSIAATATCLHFDNGRFYGWEGTYCCPGTCQHVWQYAQGLARILPQLERAARELTDYGIAFRDDGALDYRAEADRRVAIDGQAGTILRVLREHQMSADEAFLRRVWPRVRKSIEFLVARDGNGDGLIEGEQYNTLDASWYGQIPWLSSMYLAALRAGAAMAREMGDEAFALNCEKIAERGGQLIVRQLFNGEYFIHKLDPAHPEAINTNDGCHIDQVLGQSWAWQVGLPRVLPAEETKSALQALWRYNFTPDVGPYRSGFAAIKGGRWYAMPGEGGLLMCTWPKGGAEKAPGKGDPGFVAYFNECMTGFEYQAAGHMIWEGQIERGMAITRMVHDRYHASKRNPWNEVECGDHYARAMASYGVFLAACGYEHHGPKGHLGFAPRLTPDNFRAPFTAAEGWGTFEQKRVGSTQHERISMKWGRLRLRTLSFLVPDGARPKLAQVTMAGREVMATLTVRGARVEVLLAGELILAPGQMLEVTLS